MELGIVIMVLGVIGIYFFWQGPKDRKYYQSLSVGCIFLLIAIWGYASRDLFLEGSLFDSVNFYITFGLGVLALIYLAFVLIKMIFDK